MTPIRFWPLYGHVKSDGTAGLGKPGALYPLHVVLGTIFTQPHAVAWQNKLTIQTCRCRSVHRVHLFPAVMSLMGACGEVGVSRVF